MPAYPSLEHLLALSDDVGIIQHAREDVPNRSTGYCTDDVARAFMVAIAAVNAGSYDPVATRLAGTYLAFIADAQLADGRFHNFMGYDRKWQDTVGSDDSFGRAVWALGYGVRYAPRLSWQRLCAVMFARALPRIAELRHLRSRAYAALGCVNALASSSLLHDADATRAALTGCVFALKMAYEQHADDAWQWCETTMTYDNARLSEALVRGGLAVDDRRAVDAGVAMLDFYENTVIEGGTFVPIGNDGWFTRGRVRARHGEQPLEAAALIDAALAVYDLGGDARYLALAHTAYAWFEGRNSHGAMLVRSGGCCDGVDRQGVNANMGAESTLAYLAGAFTLARRALPALRIAT